jgi:hypothetical protein
MLFYPSEHGTWFFPARFADLDRPRLLEDGEDYAWVADCPPDRLAPGQATRVDESEFATFGYHVDIHFRPWASPNPNLDHKTYEFRPGKGLVARKWPERRPRDDLPSSWCYDLLAEPKIRDFTQSFWRRREAELLRLEQPGRTLVYRGIGSSGAASLQASVERGGWHFAAPFYKPDAVLRAMHALSVGAQEIAAPAYPPIVFCHHPAQVGAVVPNPCYISFLREPVRRIVSAYFWEYDHGVAADQSLEAFIDTCCEEGFGNWQMDWLARLEIPFEHSLTDGFTLPYFLSRERDGMRMSEALIRMADAALEKFLFLGITECFDESLVLAALLTGSRYVGRWPWACRSSASDGYSLSDRARRRLESYAEPEIALYRRVRAGFEERYREELAFIRQNIGSLRTS